MQLFRVLAKVLGLLFHVAKGWWIIQRHFPRMEAAAQQRQVQVWSHQLLGVLGITLRVQGTLPAQGPLLLVSNHISWLDIAVVHAAGYCRFVSKSEIKHWPIVGTLATGVGTLYIERAKRRDAMRVVHHMAEHLQAGEVVAVFPEGTTGDGRGVLPFHANLFQAAISAHAPVLPMALRFVDVHTGALHDGPRFVGNDTLFGSLWRTLSANNIAADVAYGQPQNADGRDRRAWARDLQQAVEQLHRFY
jgi:1-acyl-sn-glycerol-3-phosphate acyltransferase